jgi:hypothetical protein
MNTATALSFHPASTHEDVGTALTNLRDALGLEERRLRAEGAQAMQAGNYDTAKAVVDFAKRLLAFQKRVAELEQDWSELETVRDRATPEVQQIVSKRFFGRKPSGEITPHEVFCRPILEILSEMGGRARTRDVLDKLGVRMKDTLKPKDYERHLSTAKQIRWRNTAQWARNVMANEDGRMKKKTRNGIWEISDAGRDWLRNPSK